MTNLPSEIESALAERMAQVEMLTPDRIKSSRIAPGDIRVVQGLSHMEADSRLVLVLAVDGDNEFTEVLLVHTAPELACDIDVIVPRTIAASPYNIVVQADLRAVVWTWQLGAAVGWLETTVVRAINSLIRGGDDDGVTGTSEVRPTDLRTGLHLAGPSDPRWRLKEAEGEALRRLAKDCTGALLDRAVVWQLDPGLLRPELLNQAAAPLDVLEELLHWAMTRTLTVSDVDLVALDDAGALRVEVWDSLRDLASDVWTSLQDVILGAATGSTRGPVGLTRRVLTASHLRALGNATEEDVHVIGRVKAVRS